MFSIGRNQCVCSFFCTQRWARVAKACRHQLRWQQRWDVFQSLFLLLRASPLSLGLLMQSPFPSGRMRRNGLSRPCSELFWDLFGFVDAFWHILERLYECFNVFERWRHGEFVDIFVWNSLKCSAISVPRTKRSTSDVGRKYVLERCFGFGSCNAYFGI